jgi:hypothetical protein
VPARGTARRRSNRNATTARASKTKTRA